MASEKAFVVAGTCFAGLGLLLYVISMATPHWLDVMNYDFLLGEDYDFKETYDEVNIGLYERCKKGICAGISSRKGKHMAVQAMGIMAALTGVAGVVGAIVFVALTHMGKKPHILIRLVSGFQCLNSAMFITICVIVFYAEIYPDVKGDVISRGRSFSLSIGGGVLLLLGGCIIISMRGSHEKASALHLLKLNYVDLRV